MRSGPVRFISLLALTSLLALAACSSDDDDSADDPGDATTTTVAPDDGATDGDGDGDGGTDFAAAAGDYAGTWDNTTFGSTGAASAKLTIDDAAGTFTLVIDLDGGVFGEGDPDEFTVEGTLSEDGGEATATSPLLGTFTISSDASGAFTITADDVPGDRIATFTAQGTIGDGTIEGTYNVTFEGTGGADGVFSIARS